MKKNAKREPNYKFYENGKNVVCISYYAKRPVRQEARLDERDEFDPELGREIARAKVDLRIAEKRLKNATFLRDATLDIFDQIQEQLIKYNDYYDDATAELQEATERLERLINKKID